MLRNHQKQAVNSIELAIKKGVKKIKIEMAVGTGRFYVLAAVLKLNSVKEKRVLIVTSTNVACEKIKKVISEGEGTHINYEIMTYITAIEHVRSGIDYSIVIFDGIYFGEEYLGALFDRYKSAQFIGFTSTLGESREGPFADVKSIFTYSYAQALLDGQINRFNSDDEIVKLCKRMLIHNGYTDIKLTVDNKWGDIKASLGDEHMLFEIRNYRDKFIEKELVYSCIKRIENINNVKNNKTFVLIMFCIVDKMLKQKIEKDYGVIIWDIRNIKYLCSSSSLSDELAEYVRYSLLEIEEEKVDEKLCPSRTTDIDKTLTVEKINEYQNRIKECPAGNEKDADKIYETICIDIIKELFEPALENFMPQKTTNNKMFRMDLICTIKAETGLWWFIKHFYRTNYIVFEFKNYEKEIGQNNIVITEKYLNPHTLRNVAIIISREGFSLNAKKLAISELHKRGYLIIDLTMEELMHMLSYKQSGGNPEDIIQGKVDQLLMEIDV